MAVKVPPICERKPVFMPLPKGEVKFSSLDKPDSRFDEERPKFSITMVYTEDEIAPFRKKLEDMAADWIKEIHGKPKGKGLKLNDLPIRPDKDKEGNETGLFRVQVQCDAYRLVTQADGSKDRQLRVVPLFDAKGEPAAGVRCYSGSVARPSIRVKFYAASNPKIGCGLSLGLEAVQVIKASSGARSAAAYGFQAEEEATEVAADADEAPMGEYTEGQDL